MKSEEVEHTVKNLKVCSIVVMGDVQDVGFRDNILHPAAILCNLGGYGFNDSDGTVKAVVKGNIDNIDKYIKELKDSSKIRKIDITNISVHDIQFDENIYLPKKFSLIATDDIKDFKRKLAKGLQQFQPVIYKLNEIRELIGHGDSIIDSLFVCKSENASVIGFAMNNSGKLICANAIGQIRTVRHLISGKKYDVDTKNIEKYDILQVFKIDTDTRGIIPSFEYYPQFNEKLFVIDNSGERIELKVETIDYQGRFETPTEILIVKNGFSARLISSQKVFGGPVINEQMEVVGIIVGKYENDGIMYSNGKAFPDPMGKGTSIIALPYAKLCKVSDRVDKILDA